MTVRLEGTRRLCSFGIAEYELHRANQLAPNLRFANEVGAAGVQRCLLDAGVGVAGNENDFCRGDGLVNLSGCFEAVLVRERNVHQDEVGRQCPRLRDRLNAVMGDIDRLQARAPQQFYQGRSPDAAVVDD